MEKKFRIELYRMCLIEVLKAVLLITMCFGVELLTGDMTENKFMFTVITCFCILFGVFIGRNFAIYTEGFKYSDCIDIVDYTFVRDGLVRLGKSVKSIRDIFFISKCSFGNKVAMLQIGDYYIVMKV